MILGKRFRLGRWVLTELNDFGRDTDRDRAVRDLIQDQCSCSNDAMPADIGQNDGAFSDPGVFTDRDARKFSALKTDRNVRAFKKMLIRAVGDRNTAGKKDVVFQRDVSEDTVRANVNIFADLSRWMREDRSESNTRIATAARKRIMKKRKPKVLSHNARHKSQALGQVRKCTLFRENQSQYSVKYESRQNRKRKNETGDLLH